MAENQLEARVERLETAVTSIKVDLEVIKATMATKSDIAGMATTSDLAELKTEIESLRGAISDSRASMILWIVSAVVFGQLLPSLLKSFG